MEGRAQNRAAEESSIACNVPEKIIRNGSSIQRARRDEMVNLWEAESDRIQGARNDG